MNFRLDRSDVFTNLGQILKDRCFLGENGVFADIEEETSEIWDLISSDAIVFNIIEAHIDNPFTLQCSSKLTLAAEKLPDFIHFLILFILLLDFSHSFCTSATQICFIQPIFITDFWKCRFV